MMQPRGDIDFAEKPIGPQRCGELRPEHFHGNFAMVFQILGEVDRRHAAGAALALEAVGTSERVINPIEGLVAAFGHGPNL
jgi:hypothetical protein